MIKAIVILLESISCQFQYFSNALCNVAGHGCDINLKAMRINFPIYDLELNGVQAMLIASSSEAIFILLLILSVKFILMPKTNPERFDVID